MNQITITDENRNELKKHAVKSISQLLESLNLLKHDLNHRHETVIDGAIAFTASICLAVEQAMEHTRAQLVVDYKKKKGIIEL